MTLGGAAKAAVRLIVWYKACQHQVDPDPAEMVSRHGARPCSTVAKGGPAAPPFRPERDRSYAARRPRVAKGTRQRRRFDSAHQTACSANTLRAGFRALVVTTNQIIRAGRRSAARRRIMRMTRVSRQRANRIAAGLRLFLRQGGREGRRAAYCAPGARRVSDKGASGKSPCSRKYGLRQRTAA
jgi:hypothetical protein